MTQDAKLLSNLNNNNNNNNNKITSYEIYVLKESGERKKNTQATFHPKYSPKGAKVMFSYV